MPKTHEDPFEKMENERRERVFPDEVKDVLGAPDKASVFRVYGTDDNVSHAKTVVGAEARQVSKVFTDPKDFAHRFLCEFHPDAEFRFVKGQNSVSITCCFSCTEIRINLNNKTLGFIAMEKVRDKVLALVKTYLGSDPYIKKIPDHVK